MEAIKLEAFTKALDTPIKTPQIAPQPATLKPRPTGDDYAQRKARAVLYVATADGLAEGSGRNKKGYELGAAVREKFGFIGSELKELLQPWNSKNTPPMNEEELDSVVKDADRYAKHPAGSGYEPMKSRKTTAQITSSAPDNSISLKTRTFAEIQPQEIGYLIPEVLPVGFLSSLISQEGIGKSTLSDKWASNISHIGDVISFNHEESASMVTIKRLIANGANLSRIHLVDSEYFDFERDIDQLDKLADSLPNLQLVRFDPITSYTSANENSNFEVRRALKSLVDFAERRKVAVLGLTHLSKKVDLKMINRTIGSRAWSATPRMTWGIQPEMIENEEGHKVEGDGRFLLCIKNNLGPKPQGMKFYIKENGLVIFDDQRVTMGIDDEVDSGGRTACRTLEIGDWLIQRLSGESVPQKDIASEAFQKWHIGDKRLGDIAKEYNIDKRFSVAQNCWVWSLKR